MKRGWPSWWPDIQNGNFSASLSSALFLLLLFFNPLFWFRRGVLLYDIPGSLSKLDLTNASSSPPLDTTDRRIHSGYTEIWATSCENLFMPHANNKDADQPAHPRSLISAFYIVRCLNSIISLVSIFAISLLYRGSYMSAHVLLNLLNELGKKIRCKALPINSIIQEHECKILFIIWHSNRILLAKFALKRHVFAIIKRHVFWTLRRNLHIKSTSWLSFLMHGFITLSDATSYDKCLILWLSRLIWVLPGRKPLMTGFLVTWPI